MGAEDDIRQIDLDAQQRVLAALATRLGPAARAAAAEERREDVLEAAEALASAEGAGLRPEVVLLALLRIGQHVVRVRHRLEALGGLRARIHIRVELAREAAVRLLDLIGGGVALDAEDFVMVCCHAGGSSLGRVFYDCSPSERLR